MNQRLTELKSVRESKSERLLMTRDTVASSKTKPILLHSVMETSACKIEKSL